MVGDKREIQLVAASDTCLHLAGCVYQLFAWEPIQMDACYKLFTTCSLLYSKFTSSRYLVDLRWNCFKFSRHVYQWIENASLYAAGILLQQTYGSTSAERSVR